MVSIKEKANNYEVKETKNISELAKISVDIDVNEVEYTKNDGETFKINEFEVDGQKYRMPNMVLKDLKVLLTENPDAEFFKVRKSGEGLNTSYTTMLV